MEPREALLLLLDHIDYESGACRVNEMVGAILPVEVLRLAKLATVPLPEGDCPFCLNNEPHLKEHCLRAIRRSAEVQE